MRSLRPALVSILGLSVSVLFASSLLAQRTFVSAQHGSDSNPCSVTSPCRTFAAAISAVAAGGEVVVLDSGGYGPFTVSQAVSVETPAGIYAGVSAISGSGVLVNAGASDVVVLRGLTIYGFSSAGYGVNFTTGAALQIENCIVDGFSIAGINQVGNGNLVLTDTTVRNGHIGVLIQPSTGSTALVDHCRFENNSSTGFAVYDGVKASVRDCVASGSAEGFLEGANGTAPAELNLKNCLAANNAGNGVVTANSGPGTIRVSDCTVTDNGAGLNNTAGHTFESFGNNHVRGNGVDKAGTITSVPNI
jgi:Right handed beta helix region